MVSYQKMNRRNINHIILPMVQLLQSWVGWLLLRYGELKHQLYAEVLSVSPRFDNYNHFQKFILLNLFILALHLLSCLFSAFSYRAVKEAVLKVVFSLPPVRRRVVQQVEKAKVDILKDYPPELLAQLDKIPYKPVQVRFGDQSEKQSLKGKSSGSRYASETHCKFVANLSKYFSYANPLHIETFPFVKQMETEVVAMSADIIGLKDENNQPCGTLNSGGTESIFMAMFSYRQYSMKEKGVYKPNLVVCATGHVASIKSCVYLDIQLRVVPCDSNLQMDLGKMKSAIDDQTICVYTSFPNYPYGTCDQIQTIAAYCNKRDIPVHVDMCLGGFVAPFIVENWSVPKGVTSISADPHKYGLAGKGVSILLFSSQKYRKHQFFVTSYWPGGLYGTPGIAGSRSGVFIASAWISMMKLGVKGYRQNARLVSNAVIKASSQFEKLGFEILSKQKICVLSFKHKSIPANPIQTFMKKRGWGFSISQNPNSFQFSFTPLSATKVDEMIQDMKDCMDYYSKNQDYPKKDCNQMAMYGACAKVKDVGMKDYMVSKVVDTFLDLS